MSPVRFDRVVAILLLALGVLTLGTGVYFLGFRPAMLPEDVRMTGMDPRALPPAMLGWLQVVFRTLGGFVLSFGIVVVAVASYMITARPALLTAGVVIATLVAFGRFLISNIAIGSDYLGFIGALFVIALLAGARVTLKGARWPARTQERALGGGSGGTRP